MQNTSLKVWKPETPVLHINSSAYTYIAFLSYWVFDVISSPLKILKLVIDRMQKWPPINHSLVFVKTNDSSN